MTLSEVYIGLLDALKMPFAYLIDVDQRLHVLYIVSSLGLAFFVYRKLRPSGSFLQFILKREVWLSPSALVDYSLIFLNSFVKVFLIGPYLIFGIYLSYKVEALLPSIIGFPTHSLSEGATIMLYTIFLTLASDFGTYVLHYALHRVPFLWEFHKTHHSATVLNPITQYRIHPIELILNNAKGIVVLGLTTGVFRYLSAHPIEEVMVIGANIFSFAFFFFGANLRHSHVPLKYFDWLEYVVISPFQHQVHHSDKPEHFNRNLGSKLAVWDLMFGTLVRSKAVGTIEFGLGESENSRYGTLWQNLARPFSNLWKKMGSDKSDTKS